MMNDQGVNDTLQVATDVVVFSILQQTLKVLLVRRSGNPVNGVWALPGSLLGIDEDLDASAKRALADDTGVSGVFLEQLYSFGKPERNPQARVISVAYYALVPSEQLRPTPGRNDDAVGWFALDRLPALPFDHREIVSTAHHRLEAKLDYSTIAFQFMPPTFTLTDLQDVYEIILNQQLDKRNFRKRLLASDQIEATEEKRRDGNHRPARLYRVKHPGEVQYVK